MKIRTRFPLFILLTLLSTLASFHAAADDPRELVIRPNEETVKRWLYNAEIVLEKRSVWFDRKGKIDPAQILNLTTAGGSVYVKLPPLANYAFTTRTFEYPDGKGKTNKYVIVIEYEWSMGITGVDRKFSKVASLVGP